MQKEQKIISRTIVQKNNIKSETKELLFYQEVLSQYILHGSVNANLSFDDLINEINQLSDSEKEMIRDTISHTYLVYQEGDEANYRASVYKQIAEKHNCSGILNTAVFSGVAGGLLIYAFDINPIFGFILGFGGGALYNVLEGFYEKETMDLLCDARIERLDEVLASLKNDTSPQAGFI